MKIKIVWITADYFLDVDYPIVPSIGNNFEIDWYILLDSFPIDVKKIKDACKTKNIKVHFYKLYKKWYSPLSFFEILNLYKQVKRESADIIYANISSYVFPYLLADIVFDKSNIIFATHNVNTPKGARYENLAKLNMSFLLRRFKNFHVFSENQKNVLESRVNGRNILYAPLALKDYGKSSNHLLRDKLHFLSFGHIRDYKRIDLLIKAVQLVYEQTNKLFKVTIAGTCKDWDKYQRLIKYPFLFDLKIGYINDHEIPTLFNSHKFLVLPYQDLAQSGAITVAFNYNMPVVTSNIQQFKEFVHDGINGFSFNSESVESLSAVLIDCLNMTTDDYGLLCKQTNQFISQNYSTKSIIDRYRTYFRTMLKTKK
ncbi:glycosyltransferase family 4 protein [Draconibacterium sediminis]|uniref:Glycosyl transferase family 1 domain-containing protein n=1 Tax=Draconibacterium sediminis TaxID=1544798 RepID=A0A0D8JA67_9BACT|nr:glycosyltransferase family 4 protein [Draconibacterium sediminis]KJF43880.1 hypothetical protein LH29_12495 [Draconibacterium sediminis]